MERWSNSLCGSAGRQRSVRRQRRRLASVSAPSLLYNHSASPVRLTTKTELPEFCWPVGCCWPASPPARDVIEGFNAQVLVPLRVGTPCFHRAQAGRQVGDCAHRIGRRQGRLAPVPQFTSERAGRRWPDGEHAMRQVSNVDGVMRVNGDLSTSRAFGDAHMKQWIIADPAVSHRKLTPGDEFLVIATDGLWDVCSSHRACDMVTSVGDATRAARMLVDLAIHQGSFDNVGVVVVDLRSLFTREVKKGNALVPLNMSQKIKNMADEMLDSIDLFHLDQLHSGWLLKESRGSFLTASRWQKRWFVVQMVENQAAWDGSLHQKFVKKVFVLSYFDSERESTSKSPRKPCVIDPAIGCKREEQMDRPGRHCISLFEASTSTPFILGAGSEEQANIWVGKLNDIFRKNGFEAGGASNPTASMARTLTTMEEQDPNVLMTANGSMMRLPNGAAVNGSFDGPVQVQRTVTGGFAAIGGGWHMQGQQLASMDPNTMGIPGKGALSAEQAAFLGLPIGSVVVG